MTETLAQHEWQIGIAPRARQAAALALVFEHLTAHQRADHVAGLLASTRSGKLSLDGLLEARLDGQMLGAIWAQVQPGRSAGIWPPRLTKLGSEAVAEALLQSAVELLAGSHVRIAQALLPCEAGEDIVRLNRAGFIQLADLLYMVATIDNASPPPANEELEYEPYSSDNHPRFAAVIERTYVGTLDCPRLNGVREIHDVLEGHRAAGSFSADRWLIVRRQQRDIGCLLLAEHKNDSQLEVVYTGLVPEARGRGWGLETTRHAQRLTAAAGCSRLVLAVDAANAPAVRMYTQAGFTAWDRRRALLRVFDEPAG